jgi:hypothetical protein
MRRVLTTNMTDTIKPDRTATTLPSRKRTRRQQWRRKSYANGYGRDHDPRRVSSGASWNRKNPPSNVIGLPAETRSARRANRVAATGNSRRNGVAPHRNDPSVQPQPGRRRILLFGVSRSASPRQCLPAMPMFLTLPGNQIPKRRAGCRVSPMRDELSVESSKADGAGQAPSLPPPLKHVLFD